MPKSLRQIEMRRARLVAEATDAGAQVVYAELPGDEVGRYASDADQATIYVQAGMSSADEASVLAHEVAHAVRDDTGPQSPKREEFIDEEAAGNIVSARAYRNAVATVGPDISSLGVELDVSTDIIGAYERRREREMEEAAAEREDASFTVAYEGGGADGETHRPDNGPPDLSKLAARRVSSRPRRDASQAGTDAGENLQD